MDLLEIHLHSTRGFLEEIIDSDFGLIDKLRAKGVLNVREIEDIEAKDTRIRRNSLLIEMISNKKKIPELCEALEDTGQQHSANYLRACGERSPQFGENWPLTDNEISIIDGNYDVLTDILDTSELIGHLYSKGTINSRHRNYISSKSTPEDRNRALLEILRRCSLRSYKQTIECLRESKQNHIANLLETGGALVPVHVTLESDDLDETETQIVDQVTNLLIQRNISAERTNRVLGSAQLNIIALKRGQSIVIFIWCGNADKLNRLCKMVECLEMKKFLEQLFNLVIRKKTIKILSVKIFEQDLEKAKQIFNIWLRNISSLKRRNETDDEREMYSMETKDNKALSELRRLTECCICLMPSTDPRMLPCIHSACLKCFQDIQTKNTKKPGDVIPCPVCRKEFTIPPTGISGLQQNFFIVNLLEITQNFNEEKTSQSCKMCKVIDAHKDASKVTMKCLECRKTFCERCANLHKFNDLTEGHRIVEIKENLSEEEIREVLPHSKCSHHPLRNLNYYCGDCKTVICVSCFVEKHASHSCKDVTTVDKVFRKDIETSSSALLYNIAQMEAKRSKLESKKTNLLEQTSEIENAIRLKNQQLKALVDQHTQFVLNELSSIKHKLFKNLETEIDEIEFKLSILQSFETYCSEIRSKGSPSDVCSCVDGLIRRTEELKKENDEYLDRPDSVVEVKFKATDQHLLIACCSNVIGQIEEPVRKLKSSAIIIGGYDGNIRFKDVTKVNLHQPEDVSKLQQMPTAMQIEAASAVYRNSIYITGIGNNKDEIWKFDATSDKWKKCASLVKGRRRHSVAFVDQVLYICGGYVDSDGSTLDDVEAYDAINDRCSAVGKLIHCVWCSGNCVPFESSLYIFGGFDANYKAMSHVQVYDTKLNNCTLLFHAMPVAFSHMRVALHEKTVILLGKDNCFLYDFDKGTWQERRQFKTEVIHFGMIIENGQIFVFGGGIDADGNFEWTYRDDVRCIPLKNFMDNKAIKWKHHANLSRRSSVYICDKIYFEL